MAKLNITRAISESRMRHVYALDINGAAKCAPNPSRLNHTCSRRTRSEQPAFGTVLITDGAHKQHGVDVRVGVQEREGQSGSHHHGQTAWRNLCG